MLDLSGFDHTKYMREALTVADEALARGDGPIGCVIVHDGKVVARGEVVTMDGNYGVRITDVEK